MVQIIRVRAVSLVTSVKEYVPFDAREKEAERRLLAIRPLISGIARVTEVKNYASVGLIILPLSRAIYRYAIFHGAPTRGFPAVSLNL